MKKKAIALLSGGLDSTLAIYILKEQGIEIEAVNFQTLFTCCKDDARGVAYKLGVPLTILQVGEDYLKIVERPKYGYGKGINPCIDCRAYMFTLAKRVMEESGASFMISGEVLQQRPMSQKLRDFNAIEKEAGLEGLVVRPLSARLLAPTKPELAGIIDRSRLHAIHGRSRQGLLELAQKYGIERPPSPSAGCSLTSPAFANKVRDVFNSHNGDYEGWEFEILKMGRHFRLGPETKVVVARNHDQNEYLEGLHPEGTALMTCENFAGPHALFIGPPEPERLEKAGRLVLRYSQKPLPEICRIRLVGTPAQETVEIVSPASEAEIESLRIA